MSNPPVDPNQKDAEKAEMESQIEESITTTGGSIIGTLLDDKYKILESIAKGGMGEIFRAEQLPLKRPVAIKIMQAPDNTELEKRFFLEASTHARLEHPNTVRIFDYGRNDRGIVYIVMELLNGKTLKEEINRGPINQLEVIRIAKQICGALSEAHRNDIVHRDIKPSNIFLTKHEQTFAKLIDFGLVKSLNQSTEISQSGMVLGSPLYMSPEQVNSAAIDHRADIYALGMTLYQAITGEPPFKGELSQVLMQQLLKMPPRFHLVNPDLETHPLIEWIIFQAIQKDIDARFTSISQMRQAIKHCEEAILSGKEISLSLEGGVLSCGEGPISTSHLSSNKTTQEHHFDEPTTKDVENTATLNQRQVPKPVQYRQTQRNNDSKLTPKWLLPLVIAVVFVFGLGIYGGQVYKQMLQNKNNVSKIVGQPVKDTGKIISKDSTQTQDEGDSDTDNKAAVETKTEDTNTKTSADTDKNTDSDTKKEANSELDSDSESDSDSEIKTDSDSDSDSIEFNILLKSKPSGAKVYLSKRKKAHGSVICTTPCKDIVLKKGETQEVALKKRGYSTKVYELKWNEPTKTLRLRKRPNNNGSNSNSNSNSDNGLPDFMPGDWD